jgi:hypothetical protein
VWSNSSRCRQYRSTNLGRDAYIHDHCIGYHHNYLFFYQLPNSNLSTHRMLSLREKPLVKTMGHGVYFIIIAIILNHFAVIYFVLFQSSIYNFNLAIDHREIDNLSFFVGCKGLLLACRCCLRCVAWFSFWFDNLGFITEGNT